MRPGPVLLPAVFPDACSSGAPGVAVELIAAGVGAVLGGLPIA